jgi:H+/Cl- antiporter ClcA
MFVGHFLGAGCGFLAVLAVQAQRTPAAASHQLAVARVWAAALAVVLTALTSLLLRASHPPAVATTLIVALGGFQPTVPEAAKLFSGIALFTIVCAGSRRLRRGRETLAEHRREEDRS